MTQTIEQRRASKAQWNREHPDYYRQWAATHKEQRRKAVRKWDEAHRDWRREYSKVHAEENRERSRKSYAALRALITFEKAGGCVDCGERDLDVLQFDHVRGAKKFTIASNRSIARVRDEIAKCEVVCANCHSRRTARRRRL